MEKAIAGRSGLLAGFFCALLTLVLALPAEAQVLQGSIVGNVQDPSEAAVPGALVTILNTQTGQTRNTTTNTAGTYSFPTVAAGTYDVTVTKEGFRSFMKQGVVVTINNVTRVNANLQLGRVAEAVTVSANAVSLQTDRAEVRAEVTEATLKNTPVPLGRNYQMLFITLPGFSPPENAHSIPSNPSRAVRFSVNGTSRSNNNTRIDGASSTNVWLPHMTAFVPALESIETVNVVTNSFDAEQGLAGGAAINLAIKSGTNDIHGSLFEYHNNQHLKAYPWASDRGQPKPKFIYNQYGGTVGGPIKQNKLFYFVSYEGTRESQFASRFVDVPTPALKAGNLSASPTPIYDPLTGNPNGTGRTPFPGNIIPSARIDPAVKAIVNTGQWPNPNQPGAGEFGLSRNYIAGGSTTFFRDTVDSKLNYNVNDKLSTFLRFSFLDYRMTNPQVFGDLGGNRLHPTNSNPGTGFGNSYSGTASATYVFNPNFVVDGYFGYTLMDTNVEQDLLDQQIGLDLLGIPGTNGPRRFEGGWPRLQIDGFEQLGISNNFMPYFRNDPQWQYVANANWIKGRHDVRFGFDFYVQHLNHNQPEFSGSLGPASGGFRFRQGTTQLRGGPAGNDFNSFGSFLLGLPNEAGKIHQFPSDGYKTRTKFFSMYVRDRWNMTPKLSFSYGLRWEYFPFPTRDDRGVERFDFDNNKMLACGVGSIPTDCGINVSNANFAPRLGLAYRASDTWVVRAGYGITNDPFNWARPLRTNYPIMFVQNLRAPNSFSFATTLGDGLPPVPAPDLGDGVLDIDPTAAAITADPTNTIRGYIQSWNLTLEKELPGGWIASAGYVATRSVNQMSSLEQNWAPIDTGTAGRVLNQRYGRTSTTQMLGSLGASKYDSLQVKAERRFSGGFQLQTAYTWAKGLGFTDEDSGDQPPIRIPEFYFMNYGRLNQDIRHNFQANWIAELPFGRGKPLAADGAAAAILGGWQINGLFSAYTGRPFTVTANDASLNAPGSGGQRGDCLSPGVKLGSVGQWYNTSSFAPVTAPRYGTCGSNTLSAPGLINLDLGVFRKFQITERVALQFRAEAFNVSNTPHFEPPNGNVSSGNFMLIDGVRNTGREGLDERVFRFGLRMSW